MLTSISYNPFQKDFKSVLPAPLCGTSESTRSEPGRSRLIVAEAPKESVLQGLDTLQIGLVLSTSALSLLAYLVL